MLYIDWVTMSRKSEFHYSAAPSLSQKRKGMEGAGDHTLLPEDTSFIPLAESLASGEIMQFFPMLIP